MTCKQWKFICHGSKSYQSESNENQITIKRRWQRRQCDEVEIERWEIIALNAVAMEKCYYSENLPLLNLI